MYQETLFDISPLKYFYFFQKEEQERQSRFEKASWKKASTFTWSRFTDPQINRQLKILVTRGRSALSDPDLTRVVPCISLKQLKKQPTQWKQFWKKSLKQQLQAAHNLAEETFRILSNSILYIFNFFIYFFLYYFIDFFFISSFLYVYNFFISLFLNFFIFYFFIPLFNPFLIPSFLSLL